jgi:CheY-like chemotaxis protein
VPLDLVITDHAMPGMTGTEFIARLRLMLPDLPVVLATGYADIPRGSDPSVPRLDKPFRLENLAATIAALMSKTPGRVAVASEATGADVVLPRYSQA